MSEILSSRLNGIVSIAYNNPETIVGWNHPYLIRLVNDIKKYKYQLNLQQWLLTHTHVNSLLRFFAFLIMLKSFLRYRLGLNN